MTKSQKFIEDLGRFPMSELQQKLEDARQQEYELQMRMQNGTTPEIAQRYQLKREWRMVLEAGIKILSRPERNSNMRKRQPNYTLHG